MAVAFVPSNYAALPYTAPGVLSRRGEQVEDGGYFHRGQQVEDSEGLAGPAVLFKR